MATQPTDLLPMDIRATHSRAMDILATRDTPLTPVLRALDTQATRDIPPIPILQAMDTQVTRDSPLTPVSRPMDRQTTRDTLLTPNHRPLDTRADRYTLPIPVPVMAIPCLAILATALRKSGLLAPSTLLSLLAEFGA